MPYDLAVHPCRSLCGWVATRDVRAGQRVFACAGCGSEWVPSEAWTPIDHTGHVPDAVQEALRQRAGEDEAGTGDRSTTSDS